MGLKRAYGVASKTNGTPQKPCEGFVEPGGSSEKKAPGATVRRVYEYGRKAPPKVVSTKTKNHTLCFVIDIYIYTQIYAF